LNIKSQTHWCSIDSNGQMILGRYLSAIASTINTSLFPPASSWVFVHFHADQLSVDRL
jgi:hypothetical protein